MAKLSFSPYLPNSPHLSTFMGLIGNCGKILIFAIITKFAALANFYGPTSLLCALPRWRLWQNCRFRQLLWASLAFSPYLPNLPLSPSFMGPLHCFVFSSLAIVAKFATFANFYGPFSLLCVFPRWQLWQNCHFRHIYQIRQLLWAPFTALCFASLAIVAKLSFSPYLPNLPLSPTFMGPLHCFMFFLVGDCGKIVIFSIFAKFANFFSFLPFLLLCAFLDISQR